MIRGIDDLQRLKLFFARKGHKNLVLRIADVTAALTQEQADTLADLLHLQTFSDGQYVPPWSYKSLLRLFPSGYLVLPLEKVLEALELSKVEQLQQIIAVYYDYRAKTGAVVTTDPCPLCRGKGCRACLGQGKITVVLEMSQEEAEMARGVVG